MGKHGTGKVNKICDICKIEFLSRRDRLGKYCSKSCASKVAKKKVKRYSIICIGCSKKVELVKFRSLKASYCSNACRLKNLPVGENHPNWNGGSSERHSSTRLGIKELRKKINYCQKCYSKEKLQGHHIIPYSLRPDLVNDLNNIIILCRICHAKEHPKQANLILKGGNYEKMDSRSYSKIP